MSDQLRSPARAFGAIAEVYDRARPSYPAEAANWLVGSAGGEPRRVLELGAGTGKFTALLVAAGHRVIASDPSPEMLGHLKVRLPDVETIVATAEHLPVPSRSIDVVVCAQSFHWFDHQAALAEIARVLRPEGTLGLVWNVPDTGIPWVRKLGALTNAAGLGSGESNANADAVSDCEYFDEVSEREYRFWQDLRRNELFDLIRSRSNIAVMPEHEREEVLARAGALYDDYGRGPDGMKLPYLTRCYRTTVINQPPPPVVMSRVTDDAISLMGEDVDVDPDSTQAMDRSALPAARPTASGPEDTGTILIDFK